MLGNAGTRVTCEAFLEAQLHAAFNPVEVADQNTSETAPVVELKPIEMQLKTLTPSTSPSAEPVPVKTEREVESDEDFIAFMQADNDERRAIPDLPCLAKPDKLIDEAKEEDNKELEELGSVADGINDLDTFKFFLQELLNRRLMTNKKEKLQWILTTKIAMTWKR